ncbi:MAG: hypothetical protein ABL930_08465 [Pseudobdellovibrio sp.]
MNTKSLLDQLLKSGTDLLQNNSDHRKPSKSNSNYNQQNQSDDLLSNLSTAMYIEELARQLKIPATLKIELEKQANEALMSATSKT